MKLYEDEKRQKRLETERNQYHFGTGKVKIMEYYGFRNHIFKKKIK